MTTLLILTALLAPQAPPANVETRTVELALNAACGRNAECREKRAEQARTVSRAILDACDDHMPRRECLTLVATLAESKMNSHPTCSPQRCRDLCGKEVAGLSRKCRVRCAKAISPRATVRADSCNDRGTSAGWFQMKTVLTNACAKAFGHAVNPHDVSQAASCYAWFVKRSHDSNRCRVWDVRKRWRVSFARVAAGPHRRGLVNGHLLRLPRCQPHGYARRAHRSSVRTAHFPRAVREAKP